MRVGRKRIRDKHLPRGVTFEHGAYYYRGRDRLRVHLGRTLGAAMARWSEIAGPAQSSLATMHHVFERYKLEVLPKKAAATQHKQLYMFKPLDAVFGHMPPASVKPRHVYAYLAKRIEKAPAGAIHEARLLSHTLTKCVEWGVIDENPCRQVRKGEYTPASRERCPSDAEFAAVYSLANDRVQIAMDLALLTGLRRGGILRLTIEADTPDGLLVVRPGKTTKALLFEWTPELRAVVDRAKKLEPRVRRPLLCTRGGKAYTADGFSAMWQRVMSKAIRTERLGERFTFHDIRAMSATGTEDLDEASQRLGHTSTATTRRVYVRKPSKVKPLR